VKKHDGSFMNRMERGRQKKSTAKAGSASSALRHEQMLNEAVAHHQGQRFSQAEDLYRRILGERPDHADALHLFGILAFQNSRHDQALELIAKAIKIDNANAQYYYHQGLVYQALGKLDDAAGAYQNAVRLNQDFVEALSNLGNIHKQQANLDAAIEAYEKVVQARPGFAPGHNNLGVALQDRGEPNRALESYRQALGLNPDFAEAHLNMGIAFVALGKTSDAIKEFEIAADLNPQYAKAFFNMGKTFLCAGRTSDAIKAFNQALNVNPNYADAHHMMGLALLREGQPDAALSELRISADLTRNHGQLFNLRAVYPSRLIHDADQIQYLIQKGIWKNEHPEYVEALNAIKKQLTRSEKENQPVQLSDNDALKLAPSFNRILHYADNPALRQGALNPNLDVEDIERRYNSKQPEIIHVDELLRPEAISALRQFCLESTIWKRNFTAGYVGAFLSEGFSSPLLLQVAEELRATFPGIFHDHHLTQAWAFKQDSRLQALGIHADAAAVNVNLWITEQEANLEPSSGGLTVWDKEAPKEWDFELYNSVEYKPKIMEFLKENGASPVTTPYRENRALIFNSNLFHESDYCDFRDEYESRRINITFLYGNRD